MIFLDDNTTGDGLLSALHLLQVMVATKKKLSELAQIMEVLPQALVNAKVPNHKKESYMEYSEIAEAIGELEKKICRRGKGSDPPVRYRAAGSCHDRRKRSGSHSAGSETAGRTDYQSYVIRRSSYGIPKSKKLLILQDCTYVRQEIYAKRQ